MNVDKKISFNVTWDKLQKRLDKYRRKSFHTTKDFDTKHVLVDKAETHDKGYTDFCVGSSYEGEWDDLGFSGFGTYYFANGAEYEGEFFDGMFHGRGIIKYPMGQTVNGIWDKGNIVEWSFAYSDGLETEFGYCRYPDRRFQLSLSNGLQPAGNEYLTNDQPTSIIPDNCYDNGLGYFDPQTKCVLPKLENERNPASAYNLISAKSEVSTFADLKKQTKEPLNIIIVTQEDEEWIVKNCRKAWDDSTGYQPELYEHWISGRRAELEKLEREYREKYGKPTLDSLDSLSVASQLSQPEDTAEDLPVVDEHAILDGEATEEDREESKEDETTEEKEADDVNDVEEMNEEVQEEGEK